MKAKVSSWKDLFWETAHHQQGDDRAEGLGRCLLLHTEP